MSNRVRLLQGAWLALVAIVVVRIIAAAYIYLLEVHVPCSGASCSVGPPQMTPHEMHLLRAMGIPFEVYALFFASVSALYIAITCAFAGIVLWKRPTDRMAALTAFVLVLFSGFGLGLPVQLFQQWTPALWLPAAFLGLLGSVGMPILFYLFPDGRPIPRWPAILLVFYTATQIPSYLDPHFTGPEGVVGAVFGIGIVAMYLSLIYAQIYRYRRVSTSVQREQTKWVVYGIGITIVGWVGMLAFYNFAYVGATSASPVLDMVSVGVGTMLWLLLPLSMAVAILRYRLWDIDALINRTLVYGSLTISLAALYIGTVIGLQATFRAISGQQSDLAVAIATLVVAGVFNPWRRRLRAFIDQRFYRSQYDAGRVLADFQSRLRDEVDLDRLTGDLMTVAVTTVQPASVSLWLRSTGDSA